MRAPAQCRGDIGSLCLGRQDRTGECHRLGKFCCFFLAQALRHSRFHEIADVRVVYREVIPTNFRQRTFTVQVMGGDFLRLLACGLQGGSVFARAPSRDDLCDENHHQCSHENPSNHSESETISSGVVDVHLTALGE